MKEQKSMKVSHQFSINDALVLPAETSESSLFTKAFLLLPVEELLL